jgi:hypothetical protein
MRPPARYSASPLPSFASRVDVVPRYVSFAETLKALWLWLRGTPRSLHDSIREQRIVEAIAAEFEAEEAAAKLAGVKAAEAAKKPKAKR